MDVSNTLSRGEGMFHPTEEPYGLRASFIQAFLVLTSAIGLMPCLAKAETWISGVDGSWTDATRWSSPPASGPATSLVFSPTGTVLCCDR